MENVVFLPAFMCDERMYSYQIDKLKSKFNANCILLDSFSDINEASNYTIQKIEDILEKTKQKTLHLIGTSYGGYIAMNIMNIKPNLINKLVLINTNANVDSSAVKEYRLSLINKAQATDKTKFLGLPSSAIEPYFHNPTLDMLNFVKDMSKKIGITGYINGLQSILSRTSYLEKMHTYVNKTLIIGGEHDRVTPINLQQQMFGELKFGTLKIIKDSGHLSTIEKPDEVSNILYDWL